MCEGGEAVGGGRAVIQKPALTPLCADVCEWSIEFNIWMCGPTSSF